MSESKPAIRTVVVERDFAHAPEKLWRALTEPHLLAEWLMQSDFAPVLGRAFQFTAPWVTVDCRVREIERHRRLSYTWNAHGLESTVTWTLTPTAAGTQLRLEQTGFRPDQNQAFGGARLGWQAFFDRLETVLIGQAS